jgi:putative N6-adenine-specific DNA methylase
LVSELQDLGLAAKGTKGGAEVRVTPPQLWQLHHDCRLAEHIRVQLRSFRARQFDELVAGLRRLPWHAYLTAEHPLDVHVTCHRSKLWHSDAVAERTRAAIAHSTRGAPAVRGADRCPEAQSVYVRITGDNVQPAIDASGKPLHLRGRRTLVGAAPLRETLAAALVVILKEALAEPVARLWDPFCGSGGILLEWAEANARTTARESGFAFQQWPIHDAAAYDEWLKNRCPAPIGNLQALGSDIDPNALCAAKANVAACSLDACFSLHCGDFEAFSEQVPKGTPVIANPPYGVRLGDKRKYAELMKRFESLLARRKDLRPAVILVPQTTRPWNPKLPWQSIASLYNGGLPVQILRLVQTT